MHMDHYCGPKIIRISAQKPSHSRSQHSVSIGHRNQAYTVVNRDRLGLCAEIQIIIFWDVLYSHTAAVPGSHSGGQD